MKDYVYYTGPGWPLITQLIKPEWEYKPFNEITVRKQTYPTSATISTVKGWNMDRTWDSASVRVDNSHWYEIFITEATDEFGEWATRKGDLYFKTYDWSNLVAPKKYRELIARNEKLTDLFKMAAQDYEYRLNSMQEEIGCNLGDCYYEIDYTTFRKLVATEGVYSNTKPIGDVALHPYTVNIDWLKKNNFNIRYK